MDDRRQAPGRAALSPGAGRWPYTRSCAAARSAPSRRRSSRAAPCRSPAPRRRRCSARWPRKRAPTPSLTFTNIRERAGWCDAKPAALPKMAALLAEAAHAAKPTGVTTLALRGRVPRLRPRPGRARRRRRACRSPQRHRAAARGRRRAAARHRLGADLQGPHPHAPRAISAPSRSRSTATRRCCPPPGARSSSCMPRDGASSTCDIIFDMSGGAPLFADAQRRDGYLRVDPEPSRRRRPRHVPGHRPRRRVREAALCQLRRRHLRARAQPEGRLHATASTIARPAPSRPTAITSPIDAAMCGGCGNCSAVCPTGAVSYAYPQRADLVARLGVLLSAYRKAGGTPPGRAVPRREARRAADLGHGPARQGPAAQRAAAVAVLGAAARPRGAGRRAGLRRRACRHPGAAGASRRACRAREPDCPDGRIPRGPGLSGHAPARGRASATPTPSRRCSTACRRWQPRPADAFAALGSKRDIARTALAKLKAAAPAPADLIALPAGAPYGRIQVDVAGCTLCLACVGACPAQCALRQPRAAAAGVHGGRLRPVRHLRRHLPREGDHARAALQFLPAAMSPQVLKGEEPFHCVSCGKAFGTKSTIERVLARLKGKHAMFQTRGAGAAHPDVRHLPHRHRGRGGQRSVQRRAAPARAHHRRLSGGGPARGRRPARSPTISSTEVPLGLRFIQRLRAARQLAHVLAEPLFRALCDHLASRNR